MSRQYFGTDGIRGKVGDSVITVDFALRLGHALGKAISNQNQNRFIVIGQDTRISGDMLKMAFMSGVTLSGIDVVNLGIVPTPVVAFMVRHMKASAGVVFSASHNPYYDNGIKFFSSNGYKQSDAMEYEIERLINEGFQYDKNNLYGQITSKINCVGPYVQTCLDIFSKNISLSSKKIVLDCANGALYRIAANVFKKIGLNFVEIASTPNGKNINYKCGSENINFLKTHVLKEKADFGIAFDGDGDRVIFVDSHGDIVDGDLILLILARYYKFDKAEGVVGTDMTNLSIEHFLQQQKIPFERSKVGDRYVVEKLLKNRWHLGGEPSGHIVNLKYNSTGDALMATLQVLSIISKTGKCLRDLVNIEKTPQVMKNIPLTRKLDAGDMSLLIPDISFVEKELMDIGRIVLRPSGTESVLRIMVEAKDIELAKKWTEYLERKIKNKIL